MLRVRTDDGPEGWGQTAPYNADITATDRASPGRTPRARPGRARHRRPGRPDRRPRAQVPGLLSLARARRPRHGTLGPARQARGQERLRAPGRHAAAPAGLRLQHAARHHARRPRRRGCMRLARPARLRRVQVPHRQRVRPRPRRMAGPHRGDRAGGEAGAGRGRGLLVDANSCYTPSKGDRGRPDARGPRRAATSRSRAPTGSSTGPRRSPTRWRSTSTGGEQDCELPTWRRMIEMRAVDVVQPDICYLGGLTRTLRVAATGPGGGAARHAALGQPLPGDGLHAAPDGRHRGCRALCRVLDRGRRLLSLAGRPVLAGPGRAATARWRFPDGPGWGVEINRGLARRAPPTSVSELRLRARARNAAMFSSTDRVSLRAAGRG